MRIGGVVDDEIDDDADAALPAAMGELDKVAERAIARIDAVIVRDVVAVVLAGRRLERHQPDRGDAEPLQIIQPPQQALEIADRRRHWRPYRCRRKDNRTRRSCTRGRRSCRAALIGPPLDFSGRGISGEGSAGSPFRCPAAKPVSTLVAALYAAGDGIARPPSHRYSCRRRTAVSRRRRWRSRAAPRGCCGRWDFPASANCRCRRDGAPIWWR